MEPCVHEVWSPWGDFDEAELIRACDEAEHGYEVQKRAREIDEDIFFDDDNNGDTTIQHRSRLRKKTKKTKKKNNKYEEDEEDEDDLSDFIVDDDNKEEYQEQSGDELIDPYLARIQAGHDPCAQADDLSFDAHELEKMVKADPCFRVRLLPSLPDVPSAAKLIYRVATDGPAHHDRVLVPKICELCGIDYNKYVQYDKEKRHLKIVHTGFNVKPSWKFDFGYKGRQSYCICNQKHDKIRFCSFMTSDDKLYYFQIGGICHRYMGNGINVDYVDMTDHLTKKRLEEFMKSDQACKR